MHGSIPHWSSSVVAYIAVYASYGIPLESISWKAGSNFGDDDDGIFCTRNGQCYNDAMQQHIMQQAATAWHMTIVLSQWMHFWSARTLHTSMFKYNHLANKWGFVGQAWPLMVIMLVVYTPLNNTWGGKPIGWEDYVPALCVGTCIWTWGEIRRWLLRTYGRGSCAWRWLNF